MSAPTPIRPPQVSLAGWLVVIGSIAVVFIALDQAAALQSLKTREQVELYLSRPPGDGLGLGVEDGLTLLRVVSTLAAAAGAASAVLGWYALRRSKGARMALTVLAGVMLLLSVTFQGLVNGGMLLAMVAASVFLLWFRPARDWFDGISRPVARTGQRDAPATQGHDRLRDLPPPSGPPLHPTPYASGRDAGHLATLPPPVASPHVSSPSAGPDRRPAPIIWGCVLTWVSTAVAIGLLVLALLAVALMPEEMIKQARAQDPELGMTDTEIRTSIYVLCSLLLGWSVIAASMAMLVWRRVRWAATGLVACAGATVAMCLFSTLSTAFFPLLVPLAAGAVTISLLTRAESRAWLASAPERGAGRHSGESGA